MATNRSIGSLEAQRLRCEFGTDPIGIDRRHPELSWIVSSASRKQFQSAYRILVASTSERLDLEEGDLWDTQKVASSETFGIVYDGLELKPHQECFWKVKVWDAEGREGRWSAPARWSTGIFHSVQWVGKWIGYDALRDELLAPPAAPLHGARWVCHPMDVGPLASAGSRIFLGELDLPPSFEAADATLAVCADDHSIVLINGVEVASTVHTFQPVVEEVGSYLRPGRNIVRVLCKNDAVGWTGICLKLGTTSRRGERFVLVSDGHWVSQPLGQAAWQSCSLQDAEQVNAMGPFGVEPWGLPSVQRDLSVPPSYLRGSFEVHRPVRRATAYLAALGVADVTLNGKRVNEDYFSSGWTDYRKRVYYRAYDVTDLVRQGGNVCGAVLADGWFSGHVGWDSRRGIYGDKPRFTAMIRIEYADGETEMFSTDESWRATKGPKLVADNLIGEEYDATAEVPGWDTPSGTPPQLEKVDIGAEVSPLIQWHPGPPVVKVGEFAARTVSEPVPGVYVYDLGQNFAGVAKISVKGRRGQKVQIRYAERLSSDGTLYRRNLRLARATDSYTCKGTGVETWQPRQTFHGFQYVELSGLETAPPLEAVVGIALSSDTPLASEFECSDPKLNRLYQNILWTQRSNFVDIPTDCPQRDERLGWTGDAQIYVRTGCRIADVQAFFRKWLTDLTDGQRLDGQFPRVAPTLPGEEDGGPAWSDAGVICPWEVYQAYGDRELLERQYPSMVRYVEFCRARSKDGLLPPDEFHAFGDWLNVDASTPNEVIYMAYYARSVDLLSRSAEVLGKEEDARRYASLHRRIKKAFVENFIRPTGRIQGDTQCAYVLALAFDLVEGELRDKAAAYLVASIEERDWKLSTGFIGTKDLMVALQEIGRNDVAMRLLYQSEYPGWMFSIAHGATTIWERWDGWTPEAGFQDPSMNSFSHYSFGAVYGWMFENLGGIRNAEPGFGKLVIEPFFDSGLTHCRVLYDSVRGPIETEWTLTEEGRLYRVRIPANVSATLRVPVSEASVISLDGKPLPEGEVQYCMEEDLQGKSVVAILLPSGEYQFNLPANSK